MAEAHFDIDLLTEELLTIFTNESDKWAASLLLNWFKQIWAHGRIATEDYEKLDEVYHSVKEVNMMMTTGVDAYKEMIYEQGREEGEERGIEKGAVSAKQNTFMMILEHKFGEVSDVIAEMITLIDDLGELDQWINRALDAESLSDLWEQRIKVEDEPY